MFRVLTFLIASALLAAACSSGENELAEVVPATMTAAPVTPTTASATTESVVSTTLAGSTAATDSEPPAECQILTDFSTESGQRAWEVVNDDVMGGISDGRIAFVENRMVFEGVINTNGGGFSSIRLPLALGTLTDTQLIMIRAITDGRPYMLTLDDRFEGRDRRVSHRADIGLPATAESTANVAIVPITAFTPAVFGQPVDDVPVQVDVVDEVGLMISDGLDGPFRLQIEWLAICS